jgi:hypothetical protein
MRILLSISILFIFLSQSIAQTGIVTGKISRKSDNVVLKSIYIGIKNSDRLYTKTNTEGIFQILANEGDTIYFWGTGYKGQEAEIKDNKQDIKIFLEEDENFIDFIAEIMTQVDKWKQEMAYLQIETLRCPPCKKQPIEMSVTGNVSQQQNEKSLTDVIIRNKRKTGREHAITDKQGHYEIKAAVGDTIVFSRFGYHPLEIKVTGNKHNVALIHDGKKYTPDELEAIINGMDKQVKQLLNNNIFYIDRPPCPLCPPTETDNENI